MAGFGFGGVHIKYDHDSIIAHDLALVLQGRQSLREDRAKRVHHPIQVGLGWADRERVGNGQSRVRTALNGFKLESLLESRRVNPEDTRF
jgi:hypothetical protein